MGDWADELAKEKLPYIINAGLGGKELQLQYLSVLFRQIKTQGEIEALGKITA